MSEMFWAATAPQEFTSEEGAANLRRLVRSFIRARVADAATVDDLTQDVLVKVERAAASLSEASKVRGWVFRIARNVIADHFRRLNRPISIPYDSTSLGAPDIALLTQEQESRKAHLLRCIGVLAKSLPDSSVLARDKRAAADDARDLRASDGWRRKTDENRSRIGALSNKRGNCSDLNGSALVR
jgi:RNA polymerase sigma factor (sigma-70 family)